MLIERNHCYNHRVAEKKRCNFPLIGHYDTWLIDLLQIVIYENHGVHLFRNWSNGLDFIQTKKSFVTVALYISELHNLLINVDISGNIILSKDQEYIAKCMGIKILFLPISEIKEKRLFTTSLLQHSLNVRNITKS